MRASGTGDKSPYSVFRIGISGRGRPEQEGGMRKDECRVQRGDPSADFFNLQSSFCLPAQWVQGPNLCVGELLYH